MTLNNKTPIPACSLALKPLHVHPLSETLVVAHRFRVTLPLRAFTPLSSFRLCLQKEQALLEKVTDRPDNSDRFDTSAGIALVLQRAGQELAVKHPTLVLTETQHYGCNAMKSRHMYVPTFGPGACSTHIEARATYTHIHSTQFMAGACSMTKSRRSMTRVAGGW